MLAEFLYEHFPDLTASLLGSLLYMMIQKDYQGWKKLLVFLTSFLIGFQNGNIITCLIENYLPCQIVIERSLGCFIFSLLTITISRHILAISKSALNRSNVTR